MYNIALEPATSDAWLQFYNSCYSLYCQDTQRHIHYMNRGLSADLYITDVSNAYKTGAVCTGFQVGAQSSVAIMQCVADCGYSVSELLRRCEAAFDNVPPSARAATLPLDDEQLTVTRLEEPGVRTFSPLPAALKTLKPLNALPQKWTLRHLMRVLTNGQYQSLRTDMRTTDDYAFDNASDFGKGNVRGMAFLEEITSTPRGWRVEAGNGGANVLSIACHSFDYKTCIVDLDRRPGSAAGEVPQGGEARDLRRIA